VAYFVNKSFEPEMKVKTFCKTSKKTTAEGTSPNWDLTNTQTALDSPVIQHIWSPK